MSVGRQTCDMADEARFSYDRRCISVYGDGVLEVTASRHPADDGRVCRYLCHLETARS